MSYCRWSSMDWQCDLYLYYSTGDFWSANVAGRRRVLPDDWPKTPPWPSNEATQEEREAWVEQMLKVHNEQNDYIEKHDNDETDWVDLSEVCPKYAGQHYDVYDVEELIDLLVDMEKEGLVFPDYIIDAIRDEAKSEGYGANG